MTNEPERRTATSNAADELSSDDDDDASTQNDVSVGANSAGTDGLTRQGMRTRRQLLRAARLTFDKKGYHSTRISDITRAANISIGSFYTYFESKEEVFRILLVDLESEVYEEPRRLPKDAKPLDRLHETNRLYFEAFRRNAAFWAVVEEAAMKNAEARRVLVSRHENSRARTYAALKGWQETGMIPPHIDVEFCATVLGAMTERCAFLWFVYGEPINLDHAVDSITEVWARVLLLEEVA